MNSRCTSLQQVYPVRKKRGRRPLPLPVKFTADVSNAPSIPRPSLLERLERLSERGVVVLHAPAGYGKTCLLAEWASRVRASSDAVAWINLGSTERDAAALVHGLAATLKMSGLAKAARIAEAAAAQKEQAPRFLGESLVAAIAAERRHVFLILDNYNSAESNAVEELLNTVFEQMPRNLTLALASRSPTRLALTRLLLQDRLERLDKVALAFTAQETREFFRSTLSNAQLKEARSLSEGWPAILRIVDFCRPAWRASQGELSSLTIFAELVSEYVFRDVLATLDDRLGELLTVTSIVELLEPALADAITGNNDGAQLFDALVSRHSVLYSVHADHSTWRLPAVLRLALRQRLDRRGNAHVRVCHSRAASWYEERGLLHDAVLHYVAAGTPEMAADAVERAGPLTMLARHGDGHSLALLRLIPDEQLAAAPRLGLWRVFVNYKRGFMTEARHQYDHISQQTHGFTQDRESRENEQLTTEAAYAELMMEFYQRSNVSAEFLKSIETKVATLPQPEPEIASTMSLVLGKFYQLRGDFGRAAGALAEVEKLAGRESSDFPLMWLRHHLGALALARGKLHDARYLLQIGMKLWHNQFRENESYRSLTSILFAEIDYETDALSDAQARVDEAVYMAEHVEGWYELYASVYHTMSMLAYHGEGVGRARAALDRAAGIERIGKVLKNFLPAMRMRIAVLCADFGAAREIRDAHRLEGLWGDSACHDNLSWLEWDLIGLTLSQMKLHEGDFEGAREILGRIDQDMEHSERWRSQARVLTIRAEIHRRLGERREARRHFQHALEIGLVEGYVRVFLDDEPMLKALLPLVTSANEEEDKAPKHVLAFANKLLRAMVGNNERQKDDELLSRREREVLHELCLGHSNKLIARKLGLSDQTVKFHVQNIFHKLDVRKRTSAVAEAHRRGLISQ